MPVDTSSITILNSVGLNKIYRIDYNGNIKSDGEPVQVRRKSRSNKWEAVSGFYSKAVPEISRTTDPYGKWVDGDILRKQKYRGLKEELAKIRDWKEQSK
jgi:hypothetical protein